MKKATFTPVSDVSLFLDQSNVASLDSNGTMWNARVATSNELPKLSDPELASPPLLESYGDHPKYSNVSSAVMMHNAGQTAVAPVIVQTPLAYNNLTGAHAVRTVDGSNSPITQEDDCHDAASNTDRTDGWDFPTLPLSLMGTPSPNALTPSPFQPTPTYACGSPASLPLNMHHSGDSNNYPSPNKQSDTNTKADEVSQ
ncbi:hypothetical protein DL768_002446 [Monosporascus sp. mg162]|nr:hypothetical protein DL768_002446 [Monosporascus sp. mg162]